MDASGSFHEKHAICCALIRRMETSHERVAQTRNHRVRGWNGSDELSPGRARPRVISAQSLGVCPATASAKCGGRRFRMDFLRKGNAASDLVNRQA